jgi:hypothetical protein
MSCVALDFKMTVGIPVWQVAGTARERRP